MPVCPVCSLSGAKLGARCQCDKAFLVIDAFRRDPSQCIGQILAGKYVPIDTLAYDEKLIHLQALQKPMDRHVQLYLLTPQAAKNKNIVDKLMQCAAKLAAINHPSVLAVYEFFRDTSFIGISVEDTRSQRLSKEAPYNGIDEVSLAHIIHQVLQAMAQLHQRSLLLPNISADNILLMRTADDPYFVKIDGVLRAYMQDDITACTPSTDVASLGKTLLYLITGSHNPSPPLPAFRARLSSIVPIILNAIRNDDKRYPTAVEFLRDFESLLDLHTSPQAPPSFISPPSVPSPKAPKQSDALQVLWMHKGPSTHS